jgi:hypothetical protein
MWRHDDWQQQRRTNIAEAGTHPDVPKRCVLARLDDHLLLSLLPQFAEMIVPTVEELGCRPHRRR